uniref:Small ribosomal subunit protein uS8c n=1 Tax=Monomastix sp. (strain OKE-1) TaxID=141716 RepID=C0JWQ6_MONSK|nr:ribosomal protein S8 [Monomastix sp. OKE-1]ACK36912.1 ribosomal protein S8 [Monomastix sp. OKE-1]
MVNYAVSDMLTRIRNGIRVKKTKVSVISTNLTRSIAEILKREGFIENFATTQMTKPSVGNLATTGNKNSTLDIYLKWSQKDGLGKAQKNVLTNLKCISRPGVRIYANANNIPQVLGGLGITILSTSKGILTDYEARNQKVGGEVLCMLW